MLVLKICWTSWENASRDKRELSVYRELGHDVLVMAAGERDDRGRKDNVDSFPVIRFTTKPLGNCPVPKINPLTALFRWAKYVRRLAPDIISGHDYTGWVVGWVSSWFKRKKPKMIYDSHEFELGRNEKRSRLKLLIIKVLEKHILKKSVFSIMVNDSIADEVKKIYRLKERPVVVRSTPDYWHIDPSVCERQHTEFMAEFRKLGGTVDYIVMYHGAIMPGRGIEALIKLTTVNPHVGAVILGNAREEYVEFERSLKQMTAELKAENSILFLPAVPLSELWKYVGAADISFMMIEGAVRSYYFALPNKFFESIQSLTPMIASDFPEMKRLIEHYGIGLTCDPNNMDAINECVEKMRTDLEFYVRCKTNIKSAKEELCWEKEKKILIEIFNKIASESR